MGKELQTEDSHAPSPMLPNSMHRVLSLLTRLPRLFFVGLVRVYQLFLSPHLGGVCRYHPTCSAYAIQAFREYGALKGLVLTVHRLLRCHPWGGHGYDPPRWFGEKATDLHTPQDPLAENAGRK